MNTKELHTILYHILCTIDEICKKEHITYSLGGGTMLGAIRHQGFIPWDDDVDICLWHRDYPRLKAALKRDLPEYLQLVEPSDVAPNFYDFVPRVVDMRYNWHEPTEEDTFYGNKQNHVCVDIFLVANSANTVLGAKRLIFMQKVTYGLAMSHRYLGAAGKGNWPARICNVMWRFIRNFVSMQSIIRWRERLCLKYEDKPGEYCIIINDIPKYWDVLYKRKWFEGVVYKQFETQLFPVQSGYDEKLTLQYGDYMKPPANKNEYIQHMDTSE